MDIWFSVFLIYVMPHNLTHNSFQKNFTTFFLNEQRVNLCGITQLKTAENQMSKPQLCTNTIFIAKKYL